MVLQLLWQLFCTSPCRPACLRKCLPRRHQAKVENNHMLYLQRCKKKDTRKTSSDSSFCRPTSSVMGWEWIDCHGRKGLWLKMVKEPQGKMGRKRIYEYCILFTHEMSAERRVEKLPRTYLGQYKKIFATSLKSSILKC